jgi:hypothetical protein
MRGNVQVRSLRGAGRSNALGLPGELVGEYKNGGREWRPAGEPEKVKVHDFIDRNLGKANPYGVYDLAADTGWVSVGDDHDTAASLASLGAARQENAKQCAAKAAQNRPG